jgi:hypothetical protein
MKPQRTRGKENRESVAHIILEETRPTKRQGLRKIDTVHHKRGAKSRRPKISIINETNKMQHPGTYSHMAHCREFPARRWCINLHRTERQALKGGQKTCSKVANTDTHDGNK